MFRRHPIFLFLTLTFASSAVFYFLLNCAGGRGEGMRLYVAGLMWCPAIAAILSCRSTGVSLATLGWRWGGAPAMWASYLLPIGYGLVVYALAWTSGWGAFSAQDYAAYSTRVLGLSAWPDWAHVVLMIVLQASAGFVLSCATALGEEIGWRGFLAPRLVARFGFTGGSLAVGLVWAAWHVPVLFLANYGDETPRLFAITCFTLSLTAMSFVYSWFRLQTGSLWTAVFLHASHNAFITPVFSALTVDTGRTAYAIDEYGFLLSATSVLIAVGFWRRRAPAMASARADLSVLH